VVLPLLLPLSSLGRKIEGQPQQSIQGLTQMVIVGSRYKLSRILLGAGTVLETQLAADRLK
jgi:hypothetical protein